MSEISDENAEWAAVMMADLMLRPKDWIHRRVETVVFDDEISATRHVMVDFSVPQPRSSVRVYTPPSTQAVLMPIALMRKQRLRVFHLTDEAGLRCPVMTRETRARIAQLALTTLARAVLNDDLDDVVKRELERMAAEPVRIAWPILLRFDAASRLAPSHPSLADRRIRQRSTLFKLQAFRIVAYTLTWSYVLFAECPNLLDSRHIRSFRYEERALMNPLGETDIRAQVANEQKSTGWERVRWRTNRVASAVGRGLGWSPRRLLFPCPAVTYGHSYHFEVEAPPATQICGSSLYLTTTWSPRRNPYRLRRHEMPRFHGRREPDDWERGSLSRSHLYVRRTPDTAHGVVEIDLRARRGSFVQAGALTALLAVGLLGAGLHFRARLEVDAGAALLLLLPTVSAAFVVQSGQHPMAGRLVTGLRAWALLAGIAMIVATGALVIANGKPPAALAWKAALAAASVAALVLGVAWFQARPRRYRSSFQSEQTT